MSVALRPSDRLDQLIFDNRFVSALPGDSISDNFRRQVQNACYSLVKPTPVSSPKMIAYSQEMLQALDLTEEEAQTERFTRIFAGNELLTGMQPFAMCYGGHQFGYWAGQLGDGRAINLGELINKQKQRWILQLKGSGLTPYSRNADGLAVLRSSVREFLCSEAMFHLGIPTTRALSVILTGETVIRDMFYDGNPEAEPGAVVCRVSPSFIRFGNFQILTARGEQALLNQFIEFTIRTDFPELLRHGENVTHEIILKWFSQVCYNTARLIVDWQRVGFVHGVMNTDNMSILGLTIDYGPYGWLDHYDPHWTPNTTDAQDRRYRFSQQPEIALWNLVQLANALYPLFNDSKPLQEALSIYNHTFNQGWLEMMAGKFGFISHRNGDEQFYQTLLTLIAEVETDMTIFFRKLADLDVDRPVDSYSDEHLLGAIASSWYKPDEIDNDYKTRLSYFLRDYLLRLRQDGRPDPEKIKSMHSVNPKFILRNYLSQQAIDKAETGDFSMIHQLLQVMRKPYDDQPGQDLYAQKRPDWAKSKPGCSMLSCSS